MDQEKQLIAVKNLIETDNLKEFKEIFLYVEKKFIFTRMGGNYGTFLKQIENPQRLRYEHTYRLATILKVTPQKVSEIIHNQIDSAKQKVIKKVIKKNKP